MSSHFTLRMQFGPHQDPHDIIEQLQRLIVEAPVTRSCSSTSRRSRMTVMRRLAPVYGSRSSSRAPTARRWRCPPAYRSASIPGTACCRCDRGRTLKPQQNWRTMVDYQGNTAAAVVCPLDEAWQRYFIETLRLLPRPRGSTWCGSTMTSATTTIRHCSGAVASARSTSLSSIGVPVRRPRAEEIVARAWHPARRPWRAIWFDMWQETLLAFLDTCREKHWRPEEARMGLMSSGMEAHHRGAEVGGVVGNGRTGIVLSTIRTSGRTAMRPAPC